MLLRNSLRWLLSSAGPSFRRTPESRLGGWWWRPAQIIILLGLSVLSPTNVASQERRSKVRISNAGFTITALPLLAAKDWGIFTANGMDVELIVIAATLAPAALSQGDIDY